MPEHRTCFLLYLAPSWLTSICVSRQITYLDEYYLTGHEMDVLRRCAADVAAQVPAGAVVMELGSG